MNDAPTATNLSAAETYTEDTPLNLIDIVVSDVDSANVTATLTLSNPAAGSLTTATLGRGDLDLHCRHRRLDRLGRDRRRQRAAGRRDIHAGGELQRQLHDRHQRQRRGGCRITGTKAFTGIAVNDAPTATNLSAAETYTEDTPLNLIDIVVSDVDSANVTATLTLSNPAAGSLSTATSGAVTSTYIAGTGVWTRLGRDRRRQRAAGRRDVHAGGELQRQLHDRHQRQRRRRRPSPAPRRSPASRSTTRRRRPTCRRRRPTPKTPRSTSSTSW